MLSTLFLVTIWHKPDLMSDRGMTEQQVCLEVTDREHWSKARATVLATACFEEYTIEEVREISPKEFAFLFGADFVPYHMDMTRIRA